MLPEQRKLFDRANVRTRVRRIRTNPEEASVVVEHGVSACISDNHSVFFHLFGQLCPRKHKELVDTHPEAASHLQEDIQSLFQILFPLIRIVSDHIAVEWNLKLLANLRRL